MFSSLYQNLPTAAAMLPSAGRKADGETTALTAARKTATAYSSEVHDAYVPRTAHCSGCRDFRLKLIVLRILRWTMFHSFTHLCSSYYAKCMVGGIFSCGK